MTTAVGYPYTRAWLQGVLYFVHHVYSGVASAVLTECVLKLRRGEMNLKPYCILVDDVKVKVLHKLLEAAMLISPWSKRRNNILTIWQDIWAKYTPCPYKLALPLHFVHSHWGLRCPDLAHWELVSMYYGHFPWKKESMKQVLYFNILQCCQ